MELLAGIHPYWFILAVALLTTLVGILFRRVVVRKLMEMAEKTKGDLDDVVLEIIDTFTWKFYFIVGLYIGIVFFYPLSNTLETTLDLVVLVFVIARVTLALQKGITSSIEKYSRKPKTSKALRTMLPAVGTIVVILLWFIAAIIGLSSTGIDVTALIAGLGVGGLAVAFAIQKILADLFSAFVIFIDAPFKIGDYITAGSVSGTVENIGLKTTKIRSSDGEKFIIPNQILVDGQVQNFAEIVCRRASFPINISLETDPDKLKYVSHIIKEAVDEADKLARFYRATLTSINVEAFEYQVFFFAEVEDLNEFRALQEKVFLKIVNKLEENDINIASTSRIFKKR